jgi:hypothetical protein
MANIDKSQNFGFVYFDIKDFLRRQKNRTLADIEKEFDRLTDGKDRKSKKAKKTAVLKKVKR